MIRSKRVRWTSLEARVLLKKMIEVEGIGSIVCPREFADSSIQQRRRKQGFFKSLCNAVGSKSADQCKAKLQKFQEKFKDRLDMLSLDPDVFVDIVVGQQKSLDEKDGPQCPEVTSPFDNSKHRKKRLRKKNSLSIKHVLPFSLHKQSTGLTDVSPNPSTAVSKPFGEPKALNSGVFLDFSDGLFFDDDGEVPDFLKTDLNSNNEIKQGTQLQLSLAQIQSQIMLKWAQICTDVALALEMTSNRSAVSEAQLSLSLINDQFSKVIQSLSSEQPIANDIFDTFSIDLSVCYLN